MFNHSERAYAVGDVFVHRNRDTHVVACHRDPFGYLLQLEDIDMTTIAKMLEIVNEHREARGDKPLRSWKESRSKLEALIERMKGDAEPATPIVPTIECGKCHRVRPQTQAACDCIGGDARAARKRTPVENAHKHEVSAERKQASAERKGDVFTIAELARDLGINPKVARARLRRAEDMPADNGKKYTWAAKHRAFVTALLA